MTESFTGRTCPTCGAQCFPSGDEQMDYPVYLCGRNNLHRFLLIDGALVYNPL